MVAYDLNPSAVYLSVTLLLEAANEWIQILRINQLSVEIFLPSHNSITLSKSCF